jgi:hypothetical protein
MMAAIPQLRFHYSHVATFLTVLEEVRKRYRVVGNSHDEDSAFCA